LSRLAESELSGSMMGKSFSMSSPKRGDPRFGSLAASQARLPLMVFISPLWASSRKGWDSRHDGKVLVL
jgi:hypothetical protein